ncbi:MAG: flagellar assembly peptidoglycan hydrolase FlgJ [Proteobacteria bacterium]|nr:flagellar assembly peptidoglycan hydrolase FlgJ [Pseudomonadota bacterium]
MATTPINGQASTYGDFAGLEKLKAGARSQDPAALRQVAQQFESLFARMMLKSMRAAIGKDPIFGSDQAQMYQGMFDDQLSMDLTRGRGLGLADMLMRQLRGSQAGAASSATATPAGSTAGAVPARTSTTTAASTPTASTVSTAERAQFVSRIWPQAQQAAQQLGVHPLSVVAQAALESNWGKSVPHSAAGVSSNNLFGIKASGDWTGAAVSTATEEYEGGSATNVKAAFRAYDNPQASVQDYVALLSGNPRFRGALNSGTDVTAFATALHRGGYATDPDYVAKLTSVARQAAAFVPTPRASETPVKFVDDRPITPQTAAL